MDNTKMSATYTASELLTINAARLLRDGDVVFVGVGLPNLACNLARRTHAPNLMMIYEAGVIGAQPARLPLSIGDPTLVSGALSGTSEMTSATVEADAKRLAEKIAADLGKFFVDQGWIPPEAVKKKSIL